MCGSLRGAFRPGPGSRDLDEDSLSSCALSCSTCWAGPGRRWTQRRAAQAHSPSICLSTPGSPPLVHAHTSTVISSEEECARGVNELLGEIG